MTSQVRRAMTSQVRRGYDITGKQIRRAMTSQVRRGYDITGKEGYDITGKEGYDTTYRVLISTISECMFLALSVAPCMSVFSSSMCTL